MPTMKRLQDQEGDHVFLDADMDRVPARQDADRRQQRRQQDEEQRDAVDAHVVADAERRQPVHLLDELEARLGRVEARPQQQRDQEGDAARSTSAMLRQLRSTASFGPLTIRQKNAPTSGRKVTRERSGQSSSSYLTAT